jgi:hypothetical protein
MSEENLKLKEEVNAIYSEISILNNKLEIIRTQVCDHEETELVNYMWRPGVITPNTKVCSICGKVLI